jgi:MoaA/NifB/PqqE/SkfB family radical SAM enzyme
MTWNLAIQKLRELKQMGTRMVVFEGGEPLLWQDGNHNIKDLILYAKQHFLRVAVTTNGTFPLDVPSDVLWVSLDGPKETQDFLRSESFDRIWRNLEKTNHPRLRIHVTLNRHNWRELDKLLGRLQEVPSVRGVTIQYFYPYRQGEAALELSPEDRRMATWQILKLKKDHPIFNSAGCLKAMMEQKWACHDDLLVNVDPDGTVTRGCYVKSRGTIDCRACGFTPVAEASRAIDGYPGSMLAGWLAYFG